MTQATPTKDPYKRPLENSKTVEKVVLQLSSINYGSFLKIILLHVNVLHVKVKADTSTKILEHTQMFY